MAENLLYATSPVRITEDVLREQDDFLDQLRELKLDSDLVALSRDVVEMLRQIFGIDGTDHPLFRKLGLEASAYEGALSLVAKSRDAGVGALSHEELARLLIVPFSISAEQIGAAFGDEIADRILAFRKSHSNS